MHETSDEVVSELMEDPGARAARLPGERPRDAAPPREGRAFQEPRKRGLARFFELLVRFVTTGRLHRKPRGYLRPRL
jgi:hypothetical protein